MNLLQLSDESLHYQVQQLLAEYVEIIDDDRLEQWPELFVEDAIYKAIPRENSDRGMPVAAVDCDSRNMLIDRVVSLRKANIYALHYHRHVLSNVRVTHRSEKEVRVQSNFVVFQTRANGETAIYSAGKYQDRIVEVEGRLKFKEKLAIFDTYRIDSLMVRPL